jgi:hypothetical protein
VSCVSKRSLRRAVRKAANSKPLRISDTCFDVAIIRFPAPAHSAFDCHSWSRNGVRRDEKTSDPRREHNTLLRNPSLRPGASRLAQEAK